MEHVLPWNSPFDRAGPRAKPGHRVVREGGSQVVELFGEHDLSTCEELSRVLASLLDRHVRVVVDLTQTEFIDSSIMNVLLKARRQADRCGGSLEVRVAQTGVVRKALDITGLLEAFGCAGGER